MDAADAAVYESDCPYRAKYCGGMPMFRTFRSVPYLVPNEHAISIRDSFGENEDTYIERGRSPEPCPVSPPTLPPFSPVSPFAPEAVAVCSSKCRCRQLHESHPDFTFVATECYDTKYVVVLDKFLQEAVATAIGFIQLEEKPSSLCFELDELVFRYSDLKQRLQDTIKAPKSSPDAAYFPSLRLLVDGFLQYRVPDLEDMQSKSLCDILEDVPPNEEGMMEEVIEKDQGSRDCGEVLTHTSTKSWFDITEYAVSMITVATQPELWGFMVPDMTNGLGYLRNGAGLQSDREGEEELALYRKIYQTRESDAETRQYYKINEDKRRAKAKQAKSDMWDFFKQTHQQLTEQEVFHLVKKDLPNPIRGWRLGLKVFRNIARGYVPRDLATALAFLCMCSAVSRTSDKHANTAPDDRHYTNFKNDLRRWYSLLYGEDRKLLMAAAHNIWDRHDDYDYHDDDYEDDYDEDDYDDDCDDYSESLLPSPSQEWYASDLMDEFDYTELLRNAQKLLLELSDATDQIFGLIEPSSASNPLRTERQPSLPFHPASKDPNPGCTSPRPKSSLIGHRKAAIGWRGPTSVSFTWAYLLAGAVFIILLLFATWYKNLLLGYHHESRSSFSERSAVGTIGIWNAQPENPLTPAGQFTLNTVVIKRIPATRQIDHPKSRKTNEGFECVKCSKVFKKKFRAERHHDNSCGVVTYIKCVKCKKEYTERYIRGHKCNPHKTLERSKLRSS